MVMTIVTWEDKLKKYMMIYCTIMFMLINQMHKIVLYRILIKNVKLHHQFIKTQIKRF